MNVSPVMPPPLLKVVGRRRGGDNPLHRLEHLAHVPEVVGHLDPGAVAPAPEEPRVAIPGKEDVRQAVAVEISLRRMRVLERRDAE